MLTLICTATPPHQLSAALAHVARLLVLVAGYLHVRLPAEITLPHRKYPMSTIFLPTSSYLGKDIPFPVGSTGKYSVQADGPETNRIERTEIQRLLSLLPSASSTPLASKQTLAAQQQQQQQALQKRALPRPRPLWVDRTLATLMKEDPNAYLLFVEAITLLAWDVAWLCHSQGLSEIGYLSTWQDVCRVGRNLHELLVVQLNHIVARPPLSRKGTSNSAATATTTAAATATRTISSATTTAVAVTAANGGTAGVISADKKANGGSAVNGGKAAAVFGVYSHGTTHSYLGTAAGQQRLRSWKWLHQFKLLLDNVRGALASDMNYAEWELLASKEWSQQNPDGFAPRQD